jgi:hypothetical protein
MLPPVREMIALQKERDRLMRALMRENGDLARRAIYDDMARTVARLGGDVPPLAEFEQATKAKTITAIEDFFAALNTLTALGVEWNLSRRPEAIIAVNPAIITRQFRAAGLDVAVDAELIRELHFATSPKFVGYQPYNTVARRCARCLIFEKETMQ